jgi:hypothetical protein
MINEKATYYLNKLRRQYLLLRLGEILLWTSGLSAMVYGIFDFFNSALILPATIISAVGGFVALVLGYRLHSTDPKKIISFINSHYPQLEESTDLLLKNDENQTSLERIQQLRTLERFETIYSSIRFPHKIAAATLFLFVCLVTSFGLMSFDYTLPSLSPLKSDSTSVASTPTTVTKPPVGIKETKIQITPPPYTGIKSYFSTQNDLTVPEGTLVKWDYVFTDEISNATIQLSSKDSVSLKRKEHVYSATKLFTMSGIYQVAWKSKSGETKSSDYYKIEVIPDVAPDIAIKDLPQTTEFSINDNLKIDLVSTVSDDYFVQDAYIIATVAKGSGESVKFREEKLSFTSPTKIAGKHVQATRTIDLKKLGLEPGDELYFYAEAFDNQKPTANRSRTETHFITLLDTASENMTFDAGLGVDLMPEYFRSQRQIIIDTEKLIRNKKALAKQTFNFTSNELGYDQKVLRLKYGEFLGEEFESELASSDEVQEEVSQVMEEGEEEDMAEKFGHPHDKDNEHNLVEDKKAGTKTDNHKHEAAKDPDAKEDPLEGFRHVHDDPEEATFFLQSVRTKLKAALTEMWDAELYLRLYEPEKSLPFQYKALKLLKEVSNDSRIYVHKTGFDPPPLKEEKRLSGDLSEIKDSRYQDQREIPETYISIRKATILLEEKLQRSDYQFTNPEKAMLSKAGQELAAFAIQKPTVFLPGLTMIKNLNEDQLKGLEAKTTMMALLSKFWKALPPHERTGMQSNQTHHALDRSFMKKLEERTND